MPRVPGMRAWALGAVMLGSSFTACAPEPPAVVEDCRVSEFTDAIRLPPPDRTDLLVVVDTHASDEPERSAIATRLAESVRMIVSGDPDRDGLVNFDPIDDLWITLVPAAPGCGSPQRLEWPATAEAPGDPDVFAGAVGEAIAALPTCDRSAPIETAALTLDAVRREDAMLMLVVVTDEDEPGAADHAPALIAASRELLAPPAIAVLAGFDPARDPWSTSWDEWRADEGCDAAPVDAMGAPGIIDAIAALHDAGLVYATLRSVCMSSWVSALDALVPLLPDPIPCFCLPRDYTPGACTVTEQLDPAGYHHRCAELAGRDPTPVGEVDGAERCLVLPSDGTSLGWIAGGSDPIVDSGCGSFCGSPFILVDADLQPGSRIEVRCTEVAGSCDAPP